MGFSTQYASYRVTLCCRNGKTAQNATRIGAPADHSDPLRRRSCMLSGKRLSMSYKDSIEAHIVSAYIPHSQHMHNAPFVGFVVSEPEGQSLCSRPRFRH